MDATGPKPKAPLFDVLSVARLELERPKPTELTLELLKFDPKPPVKVVLPTPQASLGIDQLEGMSRSVTAKFAAGGITGVVTPQKVAEALVSQASTIDSRLPALQRATVDWLELTQSNGSHDLGEAIKAELQRPLPDLASVDVEALVRADDRKRLRLYQAQAVEELEKRGEFDAKWALDGSMESVIDALRTNLSRLSHRMAETQVLASVTRDRAPRDVAQLFLDERALAEARNLCAVDPTAALRLPLAKPTAVMREFGIEPGPVAMTGGEGRQGAIGTCFLLSVANALAALDPKWFEKIAKVDPHTGTTTFRFYDPDANGRVVPIEVTVSHQVWVDDSPRKRNSPYGARGDSRLMLLEMAYAKAVADNDLRGVSGGFSAEAFFRLTGRSVQVFALKKSLTLDLPGARHHLTAWAPAAEQSSVEAAWALCTSAIAKKVPLTMVLMPTPPEKVARATELGILIEDDPHAYSLVRTVGEGASRAVVLKDPAGPEVTVPLAELLDYAQHAAAGGDVSPRALGLERYEPVGGEPIKA